MNDSTDPHEFATTRWSLVMAAKADEASRTRARLALEELCKAYWYPLYAFVRYRGYSADDAQDMTQSFILSIIEKRGIASADPEQGRFRSYLLGALKHFMANEWHRARAKKRDGGANIIELDGLDATARYALEPAQASDPDAGFDREWAQETVARALERLRVESAARGRAEVFEALKGSLTGEEPDRKVAAARLGMTDGAVKTAVHRLRQRFREILHAEIAETVSDPSEIEDEMRHLVAALRKK